MRTRRHIDGCIYGVLILLSLSGACSNLYYYTMGGDGINVGTYIVFAISLIGFLVGVLKLKIISSARMGRILLLLLAIGVALSFYYLACFRKNNMLAIKASLSFFFIPLISTGAYALTSKDGKPFARLLLLLGILFATVGIFQFIVGANAPLGWQVLHGEECLYFWGVGWIRPTAWVGNSILYSALVYMLFIFSYQYFLVRGGALAFVSSMLLAGAIYVAMSRYTMAATLAMWLSVSVLWCLLDVKIKRVVMRACAVTLSTVMLIVALSFYNSLGIGMWSTKSSASPTEQQSHSNVQQPPQAVQALKPEQYKKAPSAGDSALIIFDRFRTSSPYSQGSNKMHAMETQQAIQQLLNGQGPSGWGSEGISAKKSIISDGLWFQFAIEVGLFNAALFIGWLLLLILFTAVAVAKTYWRSRKVGRIHSELHHTSFLYVAGITILAYSFYALLGGVINSSYACRITYALFWILIGCFMKSMDILRAESTKELEA